MASTIRAARSSNRAYSATSCSNSIAPKASGRVYNVACGKTTSLLRLADRLAAAAGKKPSIELLEPTAADSPIAAFLARRGPGIHHLCFAVDDLEGMLESLAREGYRLVHRWAPAESPRDPTPSRPCQRCPDAPKDNPLQIP